MNTQQNIQQFAELVERQQIERLHKDNLACEANIINSKVTIIEGRKYTKFDVGTSGKFMIDQEGNIFGIKAYGVIHKGHHYGTLNTINDYYWGNYKPQKVA
jgi:hypothetical protein